MTNSILKSRDSAERGMQPASPTTSTTSTTSETTAVAQSPPPEQLLPPPRSTSCDCCAFNGRTTNPAEDLTRPLHGWPKISKLISDHADFEAFDSFKDLQIKSLLYYQAELDKLRKALHRQEWADFRTGVFKDAHDLGERVDHLLATERNDGISYYAKDQMRIVSRIRIVLKEYNEALLQYSQISSLPAADTLNVSSLRRWLAYHKEDLISGPGASTWGDISTDEPELGSIFRQTLRLIWTSIYAPKPKKNARHLVMPRQGHNVDGLTRWVANEWVPWWENVKGAFGEWWRPEVKGGDEETPPPDIGKEEEKKSKQRNCGIFSKRQPQASDSTSMHSSNCSSHSSSSTAEDEEVTTLNTYTEDRMLRFTSSVATLVACLLPTVAIGVLATMKSTASLIGLIAVFTAIFAVGLMFLTDARTTRVEIFTATAAFSAVMVVFVQNQDVKTVEVASLVLNGTKIG